MLDSLGDIGLSSCGDMGDTLGDALFYYADRIKTVTKAAFANCPHFASISILSADSIETGAFSECSNLYTLTLPGIADYSNSDVFGGKQNDMGYLTSIAICNGTKNIGTMLCGLGSLSNLSLPSSFSILCSNALYGTQLTSL